jgi:hypothetical protein
MSRFWWGHKHNEKKKNKKNKLDEVEKVGDVQV